MCILLLDVCARDIVSTYLSYFGTLFARYQVELRREVSRVTAAEQVIKFETRQCQNIYCISPMGMLLEQHQVQRQKWQVKKAEEIRNNTVRGLEPQVQQLIMRHTAELRRKEKQHQEEVLNLQRELKLANDAEVSVCSCAVSCLVCHVWPPSTLSFFVQVRAASSKVRQEMSRIHAEDTQRLLEQVHLLHRIIVDNMLHRER